MGGLVKDLTGGTSFGQLRDQLQAPLHGGSISGAGRNAIQAFDPLISKERLINQGNRGLGGGDIFSRNTMGQQAGLANTVGQMWAGGKLIGAAGRYLGGSGSAAGTAGTDAGYGSGEGLTSSGTPIQSYTSPSLGTGAAEAGATDVAASDATTSAFPNQNTTYTNPYTGQTTQVAGSANAAPASPPPSSTPPPSSGGFWSNAGSWAGRNALPLLAMASSGRQAQPTQAQNQQSNIATTQQQQGQRLIDQYNAGTLSPADSFNTAQWEQQQIEATKAYYQRAGLGDSSMAQQAIAGIQAQAASMRSQALQNYLNSGMSALGTASNTLSPIIQQQINADHQAQQAQQNFFTALANMTARSNQTPQQTQTQ